MKQLSILYCAILLAGSVVAQSTIPTEKTLLWRISGKGLTKPSYLYGTMHLTDERVFNLSDSLFIAIEKSEGFAIEVDPDEMMTVMMEEMFNDFKKSRMLNEVVSKKAMNKYGPMLSKRLRKDVDDITVKDVIQEQNSWMKDSYTKGSMPTFLDVWLYDVARKQGKWVGGIEDIEDQTGLMEDIFNEQDLEFLTFDYDKFGREFIDSMISNYTSQNIEVIEAMSAGDDPTRKDKLLLKRNVKMASRMDSLSAIRTMVFAVGAAHLPGDSGVIDLLRKKGFTVEPVFSDKKIAAKNYKVDSKPIAWQKASDSKGYYDVELPGKASSLKLYGFYEILAHVNLFNSVSYMVMAIPTAIDMNNPDKKLLELARKIASNKFLKQGRNITKDGLPGREYYVKTRDGNERIQLFYSGNTVYLAAAISVKDAEANSNDADRFFSSLALHKKEISNTGTYSLAENFPGVEGETPVPLELNKELTAQANEEGFDTKLFAGIDQKNGSVYMLVVKNTNNSSFLPNDSLYLEGIRTNMRNRLDNIFYDSLKLESDHFVFEQKGKQKQDNIYSHIKGFAYGNRVYTLMGFFPDSKENRTNADAVMAGFKSVPVLSLGWDTMTLGLNHFSTWAPVAFKKVETNELNEKYSDVETFVARDSLTSHAYFAMRSPFEETDWYNNEEEYWTEKLENFAGYKDSIFNKTAFKKNGISGYDFEVKRKEAAFKTKYYRMFIYGDTLYTLFASLPVSMKDDPDSKRFFTDVAFDKPAPATSIFSSKAKKLLDGLSSNDSTIKAKSYTNLENAKFISNDIPLLREALMKHYDWDTGNAYYTRVSTLLANRLASLDDSSLTDFIKANYKNAHLDEEEKSIVLGRLLYKPTQDNFRFALGEFEKMNDTADIAAYMLYSVDDSLELARQFTTELIRLVKKKNMAYTVITITNSLMDSSIITREDVLPYEDDIIAFGNKFIDTEAGNADINYWQQDEVALIAGRLKTEKSKALLQQMLQSKQSDVLYYAVKGFLVGDIAIPTGVLGKLAAEARHRYDLYNSLEKANKSKLFPGQFATQTAMAEASIYYYLQDDYEFTATSFVGSKKAKIDGQDLVVYFFKTDIGEGDELESYLAAAAYKAKDNSLEPVEGMVDIYWSVEYDTKQKNRLMEELIKNFKRSAAEE